MVIFITIVLFNKVMADFIFQFFVQLKRLDKQTTRMSSNKHNRRPYSSSNVRKGRTYRSQKKIVGNYEIGR